MKTKIIIQEIEKSIQENHAIFTSKGVVNGLAGVSLFYYYLDKKDLCISFLEQAIEGLNDSYKGTNIVGDIMDIGRLLNFYEEKQLLSQEDTKFYYENYEPIIEDLLQDSLKEDNLNPVSGILKYANYFIYRTKHSNKDFSYLFSEVLNKIEKMSHYDKKSDGIYWVSNIKREERNLIELGIKHGVMGIINFLVDLYSIGFEEKRVLKIIQKGLKYVSSSKLKNEKFLFPFCADDVPDSKDFSFGLIYGDLGIAYGLYKAGHICNMEEYKELATETLANSAKFKDDENRFITDANLFYGNLGIASLMQFLQIKINTNILEKSINYWYAKTLDHKRHETKWAGFDTTFNKFDINAQLSLSHGIVGIGIMLLNFEKKSDFDFLNFIDYEF